MRGQNGITLIALIITIIILLILAGITISFMLGDNGLLNRTKSAGESYSEQAARERLELALADLTAAKLTDTAYNENQYIDDNLVKQDMIVNGDIVIVDGWQFEIDRSVPKIVASLGKGKESSQIVIKTKVENKVDYTGVTIQIEIDYPKEIAVIQINGETIEVPEKIEEVYKITKEVTENRTYTIIAKDKEGSYKIAKVEVKEITQDMVIQNYEDMIAFRDKVKEGRTFEGKIVTLETDIDLQEKGKDNWISIGYKEEGSYTIFKGEFKGQNHKIENLYINTQAQHQGLFAANQGKISSVTIASGEIIGSNRTGAIVGRNLGKIENCVNRIPIKATSIEGGENSYIGGIAGINQSGGEIINCWNYGNIEADKIGVGGIAGLTQQAKIENSHNRCQSITTFPRDNGNLFLGGIIGYCQNNSTVQNCSNTANVYGDGDRIAGIAGVVENSTINQCYNTGVISSNLVNSIGTNNVGGIVGYAENATVQNSYNTAQIYGTSRNIGGIIAVFNGGVMSNNYSIGKIVGSSNFGAITGDLRNGTIQNCYYLSGVGIDYGIGSGTAIGTNPAYTMPKTAQEIKTLAETLGSSFIKDNSNINNGYPILKWQIEQK